MDGWEFRPFHVDGQAVASLVIRAVTWRILGLIRHAAVTTSETPAQSERRKFRMSCFWASVIPLKLWITPFASEPEL
jgi:hypothetical protein